MIHFIFIICQLFQQLFLIRRPLLNGLVKPNYDSVKVEPSTDRVVLLDEPRLHTSARQAHTAC